MNPTIEVPSLSDRTLPSNPGFTSNIPTFSSHSPTEHKQPLPVRGCIVEVPVMPRDPMPPSDLPRPRETAVSAKAVRPTRSGAQQQGVARAHLSQKPTLVPVSTRTTAAAGVARRTLTANPASRSLRSRKNTETHRTVPTPSAQRAPKKRTFLFPKEVARPAKPPNAAAATTSTSRSRSSSTSTSSSSSSSTSTSTTRRKRAAASGAVQGSAHLLERPSKRVHYSGSATDTRIDTAAADTHTHGIDTERVLAHMDERLQTFQDALFARLEAQHAKTLFSLHTLFTPRQDGPCAASPRGPEDLPRWWLAEDAQQEREDAACGKDGRFVCTTLVDEDFAQPAFFDENKVERSLKRTENEEEREKDDEEENTPEVGRVAESPEDTANALEGTTLVEEKDAVQVKFLNETDRHALANDVVSPDSLKVEEAIEREQFVFVDNKDKLEMEPIHRRVPLLPSLSQQEDECSIEPPMYAIRMGTDMEMDHREVKYGFPEQENHGILPPECDVDAAPSPPALFNAMEEKPQESSVEVSTTAAESV